MATIALVAEPNWYMSQMCTPSLTRWQDLPEYIIIISQITIFRWTGRLLLVLIFTLGLRVTVYWNHPNNKHRLLMMEHHTNNSYIITKINKILWSSNVNRSRSHHSLRYIKFIISRFKRSIGGLNVNLAYEYVVKMPLIMLSLLLYFDSFLQFSLMKFHEISFSGKRVRLVAE